MFWVLKRTVSLRRLFEYPQHMFSLRNEIFIFWKALLTKVLYTVVDLINNQAPISTH